jgi:hypothetical protein
VGGLLEKSFFCFVWFFSGWLSGRKFKVFSQADNKDSQPANDANPREWSREKSSADFAECIDFETGMLKTECF